MRDTIFFVEYKLLYNDLMHCKRKFQLPFRLESWANSAIFINRHCVKRFTSVFFFFILFIFSISFHYFRFLGRLSSSRWANLFLRQSAIVLIDWAMLALMITMIVQMFVMFVILMNHYHCCHHAPHQNH